jgi:phosphomannomutase
LVPVDCGTVPTPALALHAMAAGSASVMITGSHIPADRNGCKFYRPDGEITKADELAIIAWLGAAEALDARVASAASDQGAAMARYTQRYAAIASDEVLRGWRIGIYQHSSVARDFLPTLVARHGAIAVPVRRENSFVPVDTEAVDAETLRLLGEDIAAHNLDALISTDADADRPLILDGKGRQVRGDVAGVITATLLSARHVATPVTSNSAATRIAGARTELTKVGSPFVIAAMQAAAARGETGICGFEANGGFLVGHGLNLNGVALEPLMTRDSTLPMLAVLFAAAQAGQSLADYVDALHLPHATGDRLQDVPTEKSQALVAALTIDPEARNRFLVGLGSVAEIDTTDGLRMTLHGGAVLHLRPSGNAPEMRCYVEAADAALASQLLEAGLARLRHNLLA